mmetsp:Transcript_8323/g.23867  ORF Transcript_8323/g.23867 Transcript_8323/m.23867 type:complete len:283 (-) Transcript_8323:3238-4086(-)
MAIWRDKVKQLLSSPAEFAAATAAFLLLVILMLAVVRQRQMRQATLCSPYLSPLPPLGCCRHHLLWWYQPVSHPPCYSDITVGGIEAGVVPSLRPPPDSAAAAPAESPSSSSWAAVDSSGGGVEGGGAAETGRLLSATLSAGLALSGAAAACSSCRRAGVASGRLPPLLSPLPAIPVWSISPLWVSCSAFAAFIAPVAAPSGGIMAAAPAADAWSVLGMAASPPWLLWPTAATPSSGAPAVLPWLSCSLPSDRSGAEERSPCAVPSLPLPPLPLTFCTLPSP